jgi:hypothetical protein
MSKTKALEAIWAIIEILKSINLNLTQYSVINSESSIRSSLINHDNRKKNKIKGQTLIEALSTFS